MAAGIEPPATDQKLEAIAPALFSYSCEIILRMQKRTMQSQHVPLVGLGTWNMERDDRKETVRAIRRALDLGMTHVDTAELYGAGRVEEIVAEAIEGRRDEAFLVSKVMPSNASRRGTIAACERSLSRLRTDRLDCYLLHWPGSYPLEDTFAAFEELKSQGKIRAYGVSNFDEQELASAVAISRSILCNQVLHHLGERAIEHAVIPFCEKHGIAVVGYSPFGSGVFPKSAVLDQIAEAHGATARQVALAFLASTSESMFLIPKASRTSHVEDNAKAGDLVLGEDERARIDATFPRGKRRRGVPTL
jgi:diketogulonate reductase-like aldo/keto reductase